MTDFLCISKVYIIDDNSSEEDVKAMHLDLDEIGVEYEIVQKGETERGHAKSMNIILGQMKESGSDFFVHLEDDFEFFIRHPLIRNCAEILLENPIYGQCLFNNSYSEDREHYYALPQGKQRQTASGVVFYEHVYGSSSPHGYWPGFSLRPGLNRVRMFEQLGEFIETGSFEKDYSTRALSFGWKTAYLEAAYCEHIGRKTSERHDAGKENAYSLNSSQQWGSISILTKPPIQPGEVFSKTCFQELYENYKQIQALAFVPQEHAHVVESIRCHLDSFDPWDAVFVQNPCSAGLRRVESKPDTYLFVILKYTFAWRAGQDPFASEGVKLYVL